MQDPLDSIDAPASPPPTRPMSAPLLPPAVDRTVPPGTPAEARSTGFGTTLFDTLTPAPPAGPTPAGSVFDVCHVGVLLRAVLFVQGVFAVAVLFTTTGFTAWVDAYAALAGTVMPAVLLWLLFACACRRPFGALPLAGQWAVATGLGAACGLAGALLGWLSVADSQRGRPWLGAALAGAGLAALLFQWLQLRAKALLPADTTARLAELQSRIRPHFLFNTLNTALALVRHDPARAERLLEDLAELFRVAITENAESVSLAEEVALAQRYLEIEQVRFGDRLRVVWELDPEAGGARVPPLLLQPLVENAVRHGVEPAAAGGVVRIRTRAKGGRALISIVNSVAREPSRGGHGMALQNVRERLRLMHDMAAQFEARREADQYRVQIVVPL